jgi:hypothetical protein
MVLTILGMVVLAHFSGNGGEEFYDFVTVTAL